MSDNINRFCNPPGGGRWYANNTLAEAENIAGSWRGGWLASGNEWVGPAFTATKAPERPKISAREAIERGQIRYACAALLARDGSLRARRVGGSATSVPAKPRFWTGLGASRSRDRSWPRIARSVTGA
ncbi:hypothetical protein ACFZCG_16930 [Streptomyces tanashiensis]|uniref:hypothetical protein n=1 Tax=Streptomyces tanashiensis TaxID=67367 RepID=UPI0036EC2D38